MALNFQPPSFVKPREYPDFGNTLDSVINNTLRFKQMEQQSELQRAQIEQARSQQGMQLGQATAEFGFNPAVLSQRPGLLDLAHNQPTDVEDPLVPRIREYLNRKSSLQQLGLQEKQAGVAKDLAQAEKLSAEAKNFGSEKSTKIENTLRDELNKLSQPFSTIRDSYSRIQAAAKNPTAAGDLALIFNYMKVLDPGSTVREGEFATAQNSAGIPQRVAAQYNRILNGERLGPEQRQDFVGRSGELYQSQLSIQKQQEEAYRAIAKRSGGNPENVIFDRALPGEQTKAIQPGAVEDGYRFKGGDPSVSSNWEKL